MKSDIQVASYQMVRPTITSRSTTPLRPIVFTVVVNRPGDTY
ncbi:hypothetical protein [Lactiplantibacillus daowaiensis]|uniref:Uncharacterized protein n=1 Tax=Lactiplantibacillus daowaiensis TaxID=2559918 RepID=A0ABW1S0X6_9LACO|nr:hypothetical protein [Lactiplantibacillus daowaiensis]